MTTEDNAKEFEKLMTKFLTVDFRASEVNIQVGDWISLNREGKHYIGVVWSIEDGTVRVKVPVED